VSCERFVVDIMKETQGISCDSGSFSTLFFYDSLTCTIGVCVVQNRDLEQFYNCLVIAVIA